MIYLRLNIVRASLIFPIFSSMRVQAVTAGTLRLSASRALLKQRRAAENSFCPASSTPQACLRNSIIWVTVKALAISFVTMVNDK